MNTKQGIFIVIEGTDGSGKGTQFRQLTERLRREGYDVENFDFPQYDSPSSYFVTRYLNGAYGSAEGVGPYTASLFYALDRYEAAPKIRRALDEGKIVLANRFTGSNMAHQGTKFSNAEERRGYFIWNDNLEFMMLRIPRPTISFVLRVPADIAQANIAHDKDLHEADIDHLRKAAEVYDDLTQLFPKDFVRIDCLRAGTLLPIDIVQDLIWQKVQPLLPVVIHPPQTRPAPDQGLLHVVHEETEPAEPPAKPAPRADSSYAPVLETFAKAAGQNQVLLERLIGDLAAAELPELISLHLEIKGASRLLAAKLAAARPGLYFARSDAVADDYYTPPYFDAALRANYERHVDHLLALRNELARVDAAAASALLPVASTVNGSLYASASALEGIIIELLSDALPEVRTAGEQLLAQARQAAPAFFAYTDAPGQGGAIAAYRTNTHEATAALARKYLASSYGSEPEPLRLVHVWPRNEIDLVPDILYEHSDLPLVQIREQVRTWPFNRKLEVFDTYIGKRLTESHEPDRVLEQAYYVWDAVCDVNALGELLRYLPPKDIAWQSLSPRYGYDMPKTIEDAELTQQFEEAFDTSLQLYSTLQQAGYHLEAQYATLLGHKLRCMFTLTARDTLLLHERSAQSPGYRTLSTHMHNILMHIHPMLGDAMQAIGKHDDTELARHSDEHYSKVKLQRPVQNFGVPPAKGAMPESLLLPPVPPQTDQN